MNQAPNLINHIRSATPKASRNRYRSRGQRRDLLARLFIISAAGAAIIGLVAILTTIIR